MDVRCLSRQSERAFDAIYWFSIYKAGLGKDFMLKERKLFEMRLNFVIRDVLKTSLKISLIRKNHGMHSPSCTFPCILVK